MIKDFNTEKKLKILSEEIKAYSEAMNDASEALSSAIAEYDSIIEQAAHEEDAKAETN